MPRAVVTGAAGFIGSRLAEALLAGGNEVVGVDCFTPYYDTETKRENLAGCLPHPGFTLVEADLRTADLEAIVEGVEVVYHLAAQPGVRLSWDEHFELYDSHNILATQRLLEAVRRAGPMPRMVFSSSSSVYGNAPAHPTGEDDPTHPFSPYGVTKLAGESLCRAYAENWGLSIVSLRYFTVYGPRQRPDMAIHRLVEAALTGDPFTLYGTGEQVRDFTHVSDAVAANLAAGHAADNAVPAWIPVNVAGGSSVSMLELISLVEELTGAPVAIERRPAQPGDVTRTGGSVERAREVLGWEPQMGLREGLASQIQWHRARLQH